jgi:hypothetical protein
MTPAVAPAIPTTALVLTPAVENVLSVALVIVLVVTVPAALTISTCPDASV